MKKIITLLSFAAISSAALAQTARIHCGAFTYTAPVSEVSRITASADGTAVTFDTNAFSAAEIDSVTFDYRTYDAHTIYVNYSATQVDVTMPLALREQFTSSADGAHVYLEVDPAYQEELTYYLSGTSQDGSFTMEGDYKSTVILDNVSLTSNKGAAFDIQNGKRIKIHMIEGSVNNFSDAKGGTHDACFFVNGHPELSGNGTLNITGNTKHAYASDEYSHFEASFGRLNVLGAVSDGMHIEQYLKTQGGTYNIKGTGGDGIDVSITKDPLDEYNGQALIEGGHFTLDVAAEDVKGLKCDSTMTISAGTIEATVSGNGSKGISSGTDLLIAQKTGVPTKVKMVVTGTTYMPGDAELEAKCRGIKVKGDFTFDGGVIDIVATGAKSKEISVDGYYYYKSGSINCYVDSAN